MMQLLKSPYLINVLCMAATAAVVTKVYRQVEETKEELIQMRQDKKISVSSTSLPGVPAFQDVATRLAAVEKRLAEIVAMMQAMQQQHVQLTQQFATLQQTMGSPVFAQQQQQQQQQPVLESQPQYQQQQATTYYDPGVVANQQALPQQQQQQSYPQQQYTYSPVQVGQPQPPFQLSPHAQYQQQQQQSQIPQNYYSTAQ